MSTDIDKAVRNHVHAGEGFVDIEIYVKPESSETKLVVEGGDLIFYTDEPLLQGRANASLIRYLSRVLRLSPSKIDIVYGVRERLKRVRVYDVDYEQIVEKLVAVIKGGT
ncbi:MAG TPA: DUF167 domain-containing protein [Pyrodictiaceae archaeon]|nr:DUF167 domain-containing protein [Pyrodictiaceae archaeon]HIP85848.1 DUF167 domain-containing protein [Pyrodictium sp.]HIQ10909.1 DUF167 domain-containing protein [Pyrodictium sp.]HIQ55742.1 DUF167 domain-containing protein [Pyrodictium sp.]